MLSGFNRGLGQPWEFRALCSANPFTNVEELGQAVSVSFGSLSCGTGMLHQQLADSGHRVWQADEGMSHSAEKRVGEWQRPLERRGNRNGNRIRNWLPLQICRSPATSSAHQEG